MRQNLAFFDFYINTLMNLYDADNSNTLEEDEGVTLILDAFNTGYLGVYVIEDPNPDYDTDTLTDQ